MEPLRTQLERRVLRLASLTPAIDGREAALDTLSWLLRHGVDMDAPARPWTEAERRLIGLLSRSICFHRARCYANAQQAVLVAAELGAVTAGHILTYCEGYAYLPLPAPFSHGWCLLNGHVWDPSLEHLGIPARYLGVSIPTEFIRQTVLARGTFAALLHPWRGKLSRGNARPPVERTVRVGSAVRPGAGLADAAARV